MYWWQHCQGDLLQAYNFKCLSCIYMIQECGNYIKSIIIISYFYIILFAVKPIVLAF